MQNNNQEIFDRDIQGVYQDKSEKAHKKSFLKKMLPRSLFGRSLLILVIPIFLLQLVSAIVFYDNHWTKILDRLAYAVVGEIAIIAANIEDGANDDTINRMTGFASRSLELLITYERGAFIRDKDFSGQHAIWKSLALDHLSRELEEKLRKPFYVHADFTQKWIEINIQLNDGVLTVVLPERRLFSSSGHVFLLWMFSTSLILCLVAVLFMRNQIRPIRRLAIAAEWFGRGRDVQKFKIEGASEVRQAGQAFLDMRRRIKRQVSQRTIMLAGVSHDLRTPLTRMKLTLEMMGENEDIAAMKADILQMQQMIDGYLNFVRGQEEEEIISVELAALMKKIGEDYARQGHKLWINVPEYIALPLRPLTMERALANVIGNGLKYGTQIWISAEISKDDRAEIIIEDDGQGIPEDKYDDVFKPFFRLDPSRSQSLSPSGAQDSGSVGLGLPIAMDIVHNHGGRMWLDKSVHGGLKVVIRLPL